MKKAIIAAALLMITAVVFSQEKQKVDSGQHLKKDTAQKKDTVYVPVYLFDITDTVSATVLYKEKEGSNRIYSKKGFALLRGFQMVDKKGILQWVDKPKLVGALDDKKKPVKNVIQVL